MSRYQQRSPVRQTGIPTAWTSSPERKDLLHRAVALFEAALKSPKYDGNEGIWDPILELLNLPLCYQPAIVSVLGEERWRTATNPKAYVATAAYSHARSMNLVDFSDRDLRKGGTPGVDNNRSRVCPGDDDDGPLSYEEKVEYDYYRSAVRQDWDSIYWSRIPQWLRHPVEYERVDWHKVARHAALKPSMVRPLAFVLSLRFGERLTREQAIRRAMIRGYVTNVGALWKWIDRNIKDRIAPLFRMESPPATATPTTAKQSPRPKLSAARAVRQVCARERVNPDWIGSPSIKQDRNDLCRYTILQPGTQIRKRDAYGVIDGTPYRTD